MGELKPVAYARKWFIDGEVPKKVKNANNRMAWPMKFKLIPITPGKALRDDVLLYDEFQVAALQSELSAKQARIDALEADSALLAEEINEFRIDAHEKPVCFMCHGTRQHPVPWADLAGVIPPPVQMTECLQCKTKPADQPQDNDGWIPWAGGKSESDCPVAGHTRIKIKTRAYGENVLMGTDRACVFRWDHSPADSKFHGSDIIAYRVVG